MSLDNIKSGLKSKKVFVISKSYCPHCIKAKDILAKYDIKDIEIIEIDNNPEMDAIQDYMKELTGARSVPRVFIGGKCIGGGSETEQLHNSGKLKEELEKVGAL